MKPVEVANNFRLELSVSLLAEQGHCRYKLITEPPGVQLLISASTACFKEVICKAEELGPAQVAQSVRTELNQDELDKLL